MEHIINAFHGILQCALVAHVTYIELDLVCHLWHTSLEVVTHIVLFLLVTAEDTDLSNIGSQETVQHGITEATCTSGDKEDFVFKYAHIYFVSFVFFDVNSIMDIAKSVSFENIPCIDLLNHIIQTAVIPVRDDGLTLLLELGQIIDDK